MYVCMYVCMPMVSYVSRDRVAEPLYICMYVCMYVCMYAYGPVCLESFPTYIHGYIHMRTCIICSRVGIGTELSNTYIHTHTPACIHIYTCVPASFVHVWAWVRSYPTHTHTHTHTHTYIHTHVPASFVHVWALLRSYPTLLLAPSVRNIHTYIHACIHMYLHHLFTCGHW
jgi:hypothetical protein